MKRKSQTVTKNYSVLIPGSTPVIIRQTTTVAHAVKHAAYASQLRITVKVIDNRTSVTILELPAIDRRHAEKARNKRDRRTVRLAKRANKKG